MAIKNLTKNEVIELSRNPYVNKITGKSISYTEEFKQIFIQEYTKGILPREIFETTDLMQKYLDVNVLKVQLKDG